MSQTDITIAGIFTVLLLLVGGCGYWFVVRPHMALRAHQAQVHVEQKKPPALLDTVKVLRSTAQAYQKKMTEQGTPLSPGHVITLDELATQKVVPFSISEGEDHMESFSYAILPDAAPPEALEMEVVTARMRVVMSKAGQGDIYRR